MQGLILLDKPEGISSFGAVAATRRCFNEKRAGHAGTLDPFATGVLPVLLGRATRLSSYILESNKGYLAEIMLGTTTDTLDITGKILAQNDVCVSLEQINSVLSRFTGKISQVPPMYSAIHKDGVRLYELARRGEQVEREEREVEIFNLDLLNFADNKLTVYVNCSKGTYIRSLADDIGRALGCGATVSKLRRTISAGFTIENCVTLDSLRNNPKDCLLSAELAVMHFDSVDITKKQADRVLNGGELSLTRCSVTNDDGKLYRIKHDGEFIALGQINSDKQSLMVKCVIKEDK